MVIDGQVTGVPVGRVREIFTLGQVGWGSRVHGTAKMPQLELLTWEPCATSDYRPGSGYAVRRLD